MTQPNWSELNTKFQAPPPEFDSREYNGTQVQYLGWTRICDCLNKDFGVQNWSFVILSTEGSKSWSSNDMNFHTVTCLGKLSVRVGSEMVVLRQTFGSDTGVARSPHKAMANASKKAASNALVRCAAMLGCRFGLGHRQEQTDRSQKGGGFQSTGAQGAQGAGYNYSKSGQGGQQGQGVQQGGPGGYYSGGGPPQSQ